MSSTISSPPSCYHWHPPICKSKKCTTWLCKHVYSGIVIYVLCLLSDKLSFRYAKPCCFMTNKSNQFKQRRKASFFNMHFGMSQYCNNRCDCVIFFVKYNWSESEIKHCLQRIATEASHSWRPVLQVCNFEKKWRSCSALFSSVLSIWWAISIMSHCDWHSSLVGTRQMMWLAEKTIINHQTLLFIFCFPLDLLHILYLPNMNYNNKYARA